jgi:putative ABC transport system ATP-binding protein
MLLEARDVYRFHEVDGRQVPILKGISFGLETGTFTTIMGPSGSGKSTLLHVLAGLDLPSAGSVRLDGVEVTSLGEDARATLRAERIGFVFQFFNLLPDLTVAENVTLPLLIRGDRPERHADRLAFLLDALGLAGLANRLPRRLSGGEMQRVSIARALIHEPRLVLADEPTGNLSSKAGEEIVALLRDVRTKLGATVLLVTHNPRDAAAGDEIRFLHDGRMEESWRMTGGGFAVGDVFGRLQELGI